MSVVYLVVGLALLAAGAELLVRGASRLALLLGVSPLVVGLTVVAYGTSAPEVVVSAHAALAGNADIAVGNAIGSNILNILLILGVCAAIRPLSISLQLVHWDVPMMIAASVVLLAMAWDGILGKVDGLLLLSGFFGYSWFVVWRSGRDGKAAPALGEGAGRAPGRGAGYAALQLLFIVLGLAVLVVGARLLVDGASEIARSLGVSDLLIGLTIVALGTSMPEVAVSVAATIRGARDIAVGNVVGSTIFNITGALGIGAALAPSGIVVPESVLHFDMPMMIFVTAACLPIFASRLSIRRWEGFLLVGYYVAYNLFLVLKVHRHGMLGAYEDAMRLVILPVTALLLFIVIARAIRRGDFTLG